MESLSISKILSEEFHQRDCYSYYLFISQEKGTRFTKATSKKRRMWDTPRSLDPFDRSRDREGGPSLETGAQA